MAMAGLWAGLFILLSLLRPSEAVRCYTDLDKTKVGHFNFINEKLKPQDEVFYS